MAGDWETVEFGDLLANGIRTGVYKGKAFHGSGIKIVNMGELFANPRLRNVPMKRVQLTEDEIEKSSLQPGDLLFARRSLVAEGAGKCSIVMEVTEPTTFESSIIRARPDRSKSDSLFLHYMFSSPQGRYLLGTILRQVAVSGITGSDLIRLRVPKPPLKVQQAIACILGALDDKIELNRRINQTLEAMARAIFKSWFVDFNPVRAKAEGREPGLPKEIADIFPDSFQESELGEIPKGWTSCRWGEIASLEYGKSLRDYSGAKGPFRVFGTNGPIGWHTEPLCNGPGIIIGRKGAYRGVNYSPEPFFVIDTAFYLKPKANIDLKWAYYELLKFDINGMDSGSAIPSTSRDDFYAIPVCLPSQEVLHAYGATLQPAYDRRDANERENGTLSALRDTLLPKLISGELRVLEADRIVGRVL